LTLGEASVTDLPSRVRIAEEGPREAFQIVDAPIATADKIALVDALSATGVGQLQVASFVSPKRVPGWADAEAVVAGFAPRGGVAFTALWFNPQGLHRALAFRDRLSLGGSVTVAASEPFSRRNLNRDHAGQLEAMRAHVAEHRAAGVPITRVSVQAAFGCNFGGEVGAPQAMTALRDAMALAAETGCEVTRISLADTMGWANPRAVARLVGAVREAWPQADITLHLHDTRGLGIANALAGLRLGVTGFDAAVGGAGGCPFAGQPGAPGNIATEELVLLCEEMGIATGIDLEALIAAGHLLERILGRQLPSALLRGGSLAGFRARQAA
jgi:isopropylmalate/homocitrate/citramalate synthase